MKKLLLKLLLAFALLGMVNLSNGQTILLSENFSSGAMPVGWTQDSAGVTPFYLWEFNNPGGQIITGGNFDASFVILDSDNYGTGNTQDVYLNLPSVNASAAASLFLVMDQQYRDFNSFDYHQIEVSIDGGASWTQILTDTATNLGWPNPAVHSAYDITALAAGQSSVLIRFHYVGTYGWWWAIDNVEIVDALPPPPANDDCANAIALTVGATCTPTTFVLGTATSSGGLGCSGGVADDDVWFSFVANGASAILRLASPNGLPHTVEVFDGCGGTSIACLSPGTAGFVSMISGLTNGNTYYLAVYTTAAAVSDVANIDICLETPPSPPVNDDCGGAVSLTVAANCTPTAGTLAGATDSGLLGCTGTSDDDVWYSFVANDTVVSIQVSGHGMNNPVIEVFDGCAGTSIQCINFLGSASEAGLARTLTIGNTYYFRVYSFGATLVDSADFEVCVVNVVIPSNDDCVNAIVITAGLTEADCNPNSVVVTTDLSTASTPNPSCSSSNYFDDLWYSFTATDPTMTAMAYNISAGVVSAGGIGYVLYDGSCGGTELFCFNPPTPNTRAVFTGLAVGNTYYLRTFTASGLTAGTWNLCVFGGLFTGIQENALTNLQLYPHPTTGILNISVDGSSAKTTIMVFDMIGNLMTKEVMQNTGKTTIDLSSFANGIYFVKVENEKGLSTQKVVLSK